jgi:hypothetical protein
MTKDNIAFNVDKEKVKVVVVCPEICIEGEVFEFPTDNIVQFMTHTISDFIEVVNAKITPTRGNSGIKSCNVDQLAINKSRITTIYKASKPARLPGASAKKA